MFVLTAPCLRWSRFRGIGCPLTFVIATLGRKHDCPGSFQWKDSAMDIAHELITIIDDPAIPDKDRIMKTRSLVETMTERLDDSETGGRMRRTFNDAYLNLQLAVMANHPSMIEQCRQQCRSIIAKIDLAARAASGETA
jgi:hypothetical protein